MTVCSDTRPTIRTSSNIQQAYNEPTMRYPATRILRTCAIAMSILATCHLSGCSDDPINPPDDSEEILPNVITLRLTSSLNPAEVVVSEWKDLDGIGGAPGISDTIRLTSGTAYNGTLRATFVGKINNRDTTIDLTPDYIEFGTQHQFFYTPGGGTSGRLAVTLIDHDASHHPLGLMTRFAVTAGPAADGTLRIELGHYDDPARPKTGTLTPYARDIDIVSPVAID